MDGRPGELAAGGDILFDKGMDELAYLAGKIGLF
jgi:hypothetical protein